MSTQLKEYVKRSGPNIEVGSRKFVVDGIADEDNELAVATFKGPRASYSGVLCLNQRVVGRPGAEVWSIIGTRREVASFAIFEGKILTLTC